MSVDIESHLYRADSWLKRARDSSDHLDGQFIFCWIALNALYGQRENESGPPRDRQDLHIFLGRIAGCEAAAALALHKGRHFWSNATDALRIGLFGVLDGLLRSQLRTLNGRSKTAADDDFRDRKFFFVHSCKVRPVPATLTAPPDAVIASCARRHLVEEIVALGPRAVCFLGHNTLPAAGILGLAIDDRAITAELKSENGQWNGLGMATVQPIRGAEPRTGRAIRCLFDEARLLRSG